LGWLWHCPQILRPDWKGFPRINKAYNLLTVVLSDEGKKFYNIGPRATKLNEEFLFTFSFKNFFGNFPKQTYSNVGSLLGYITVTIWQMVAHPETSS
jgi:hypothetical protein